MIVTITNIFWGASIVGLFIAGILMVVSDMIGDDASRKRKFIKRIEQKWMKEHANTNSSKL